VDVLDLGLHVLDGVVLDRIVGLHVQGDGLAGEGRVLTKI